VVCRLGITLYDDYVCHCIGGTEGKKERKKETELQKTDASDSSLQATQRSEERNKMKLKMPAP
jgi:hypothetical protein